jgi:hypothetical protein
VIGLFLNADGSVSAARSSTFSRLAFTLVARWFLRLKLGQEPSTQTAGVFSPTLLAVLWLCVGLVATIASPFVLSTMGYDGLMGLIVPTCLFVGSGVALARWRGWDARSAPFAIVWLGSALTVGLLTWPILDIAGIAGGGSSFFIGLAFFLLNLAAFVLRLRRAPARGEPEG